MELYIKFIYELSDNHRNFLKNLEILEKTQSCMAWGLVPSLSSTKKF